MSAVRRGAQLTPMPTSGTFSSNGYGLDQPSAVDSYVLRPVPNPTDYGFNQAPMLTIPRGGFSGVSANPAPSALAGVDPDKANRAKYALWFVGGAALLAGAWTLRSAMRSR